MFRKPMKNNNWKTYGSKRKTQTLTCIRKKVEQSEMLHTAGGNVKCTVRTWKMIWEYLLKLDIDVPNDL